MGEPTLLLTRPHSDSERFAAACREELGRPIPVVISPVLYIRPLPVDLDPSVGGTLLFTSENGVTSLAGQVDLSGRLALCVGDRTARAAEAAGMVARSAGGDVEALLALAAEGRPDEPLLHVRGVHAKGDLAGRLKALGFNASEVVAYDQQARPLTDEARDLIRNGDPVVLPLFSPRSATLVRDQIGSIKENLTIVAISPVVASVLRQRDVLVAKAPEAAAMVEEVVRLFRTTRLVAPKGGG